MSNIIDMCFENLRLATYTDWKFKNSKTAVCTPTKMAAAGFYAIGGKQEPDLVKCFVCLKELDGWSPSDDPFYEHQKHAPTCPFVKLSKSEYDFTVNEFISLIQESLTRKVQSEYDNIKKLIDNEANIIRDNAVKIMKSKKF